MTRSQVIAENLAKVIAIFQKRARCPGRNMGQRISIPGIVPLRIEVEVVVANGT